MLKDRMAEAAKLSKSVQVAGKGKPIREMLANRKSLSEKDINLKIKQSEVVVKTIEDIKKIINNLYVEINHDLVMMSVKVPWIDPETNERGIDNIEGKSEVNTLYDVLIDGLNKIKTHNDIIDKNINNINENNLNIKNLWRSQKYSVDNLIEKRLGGKRNGLRIRWTINDGVFELDPFIKKTYKVEIDNDEIEN